MSPGLQAKAPVRLKLRSYNEDQGLTEPGTGQEPGIQRGGEPASCLQVFTVQWVLKSSSPSSPVRWSHPNCSKCLTLCLSDRKLPSPAQWLKAKHRKRGGFWTQTTLNKGSALQQAFLTCFSQLISSADITRWIVLCGQNAKVAGLETSASSPGNLLAGSSVTTPCSQGTGLWDKLKIFKTSTCIFYHLMMLVIT